MKKLKFSLALMMAAFISFSALAQQQAAPAKAPAETKTADQNVSPKQEWLKHYNEIKLKVDKYLATVKQNGASHTDFAQETKRLDQITKDFKSKIDEWDNATQEERDRYSATLKQFYARVQQQADKVKVMYDQIRSDAAPKQTEQK
jgi:uncharacterized protein YicC (UPF0701 family)